MELDPNRWFVKWFFWSVGIWDEFTNQGLLYEHEKRTNLCFFIRVSLVWVPLVLALHIVVFGALIFALTAWPFSLFGGTGYLYLLLAVATLTGVVLGVKKWNRWREEKVMQKYREEWEEREVGPFDDVVYEVPPEPSPGFWDVLIEWLVAHKKKICPTITFRQEGVER